jgi:RNA polymerase sigma factor (sigma-70 family)
MKEFDVTAILRLKHGGLRAAVRKLGTQSALAKHLGVSEITVNKWCNLRACPPSRPGQWWTQERIDDVAQKLHDLTGKTLDELFPQELRDAEDWLKKSKTVEVDKPLPIAALIEHHERTVARLTGPVASERAEASELKELVDRACKTLSHRERGILQMRFGLGDGATHTLEETANQFGVTKERIRQLEAKAIRKLRQPSRAEILVDYA